MMNSNKRPLNTGGDPRALADFAALREEVSKLTHPARPDVNWQYVETLCLNLFERNGVELQTAAWYTQARTQLAGLAGLNEGLAIVVALVTHQWSALWPQATHARMEILSGLSQRLQQMMRARMLSYGDLRALYQAEQHLTTLGEVLQRLELKHLSQTDALRSQVHHAAIRLENSDASAMNQQAVTPGIVLPASAATIPHHHDVRPSWVYVAQPEPQVAVEAMAAPIPTPWKPFAAGMAVAALIGGLSLWGWHGWTGHSPEQTQLLALVAPLPKVLSTPQLQTLRQDKADWLASIEYPQAVQQQLTQLTHLPPDWAHDYGNQLVGHVQTLWPQSSMAQQMAASWQQQQQDSAMPLESLAGWHQGMTQLQQLTSRLNGLDGQRGKYMTVSELKSAVFAITQSFNKTVPLEEQLRQLSVKPSSAGLSQTKMQLERLLSRYALLKKHNPSHEE